MAKEQTPPPAGSTSWSHQDLITDNQIDVATLPEKTQRKLKKFADATDDDQKDALDIVIFGEIDEIVEAKKEADKLAATKVKRDEHNKGKTATPKSVAGAPTANPPAGDPPPPPPAPPARSFMRKILGQP